MPMTKRFTDEQIPPTLRKVEFSAPEPDVSQRGGPLPSMGEGSMERVIVAVNPAPVSAGTDGTASVREAYRACAAMTRAASTNFYYALLTLPPDKRNAIYAAYAFCRLCDDIVDEPERRGTAAEELRATRAKLAGAYRGETDGPIWTALFDAQRRFGISEAHLADVIAGCAMDLTQDRYATFSDLEGYCRRVAGAVGLVVIQVCGYSDQRAVQHAIDLGIGMQLTNIVRDLAEDARNGRVYLPQDEMRRFGYSEAELLAGEINGRFRGLMRFQCERARRYFASGEKLFPYLDRRSRSCPETIYRVYRGLLDRTEAAGYDVFSRRITLSRGTKLALAARLWLRSRVPALR